MLTLTFKELVILVCVVAITAILVWMLFKGLFRVALATAVIAAIFAGGFVWMPSQVTSISPDSEIKPGGKDPFTDHTNTKVEQTVKEGFQYLNDQTQSWHEALESLKDKILPEASD